jgi:hypothetical protein
MPLIQASTLDPSPTWGTLIELQALGDHLIHQAWHILLSPNPPTFMDVGNGLPRLNPLDIRVIKWDIPNDGIHILMLFVGINYDLVAVL